MGNLSALFVSAATVVVLASSVLAQDAPAIRLPEPAEGNVDGRQGIVFWPIVRVDGENKPADPAGCIAYLVPPDVDRRIAHDCGKWFAPPADRYTVWLEQGNRISPQIVINSAGAPFADNGSIVTLPMNDAGFAAIAPGVTIGSAKSVRLLSLEPSSAGFEKRFGLAEGRATVRLPAGRAIAGFFDEEGRALALSRPFTTSAGKPTIVTPRVPEAGSDLMLVLGKRSAGPREREARKTKITAVIDGKATDADVFYETHGRIIAIWYGVTAGTVKLDMTSDIFRLVEKEARLTPGTVTTIREDLRLNTTGVIR